MGVTTKILFYWGGGGGGVSKIKILKASENFFLSGFYVSESVALSLYEISYTEQKSVSIKSEGLIAWSWN